VATHTVAPAIATTPTALFKDDDHHHPNGVVVKGKSVCCVPEESTKKFLEIVVVVVPEDAFAVAFAAEISGCASLKASSKSSFVRIIIFFVFCGIETATATTDPPPHERKKERKKKGPRFSFWKCDDVPLSD
jgi:hypothetical protein